MSVYDPNGKTYTNHNDRIYDQNGYVGQFDSFGNFNTNDKSYQIDQYNNVIDKSSGELAGKIDGDRFIPNSSPVSSSHSSSMSAKEMREMFGFSWISLLVWGIVIGFLTMGTLIGVVKEVFPQNGENLPWLYLAISADLLPIVFLVKNRKLLHAIKIVRNSKDLDWMNILNCFRSDIVFFILFAAVLIITSIKLKINIFALFPKIWYGTLKGLFGAIISSF